MVYSEEPSASLASVPPFLDIVVATTQLKRCKLHMIDSLARSHHVPI